MDKKIITNKFYWAVACLAVVACTGDDLSSFAGGTPLRVEIQSIQPTRAAITSTTLPDDSLYSIYVTRQGQTVKRGDNGYNIPVRYKGGVSTLSREYVLQPATNYNVYAVYPQENSSDTMTVELETSSQTDYLYGYAIGSNGEKAVINEDNHVAKIQLRHALALLKFNIFQSEENKEENIITGARLPKWPTRCTLNLQNGKRTNYSWNRQTKECNLTVNQTPQTVEMLVLPYEISWPELEFCVNGKWIYATHQTTISEGNSYTFNVEIRSDATMIISNPIIIPREDGETKNITLPLK